MALTLVSLKPDFFCRGDAAANVGGPFCARCGKGIKAPAGQGMALMWCYGCGFESGALPLVELPYGWGDFLDAVTFDEALRIGTPGFNPMADPEM